MDSNDKIGYCDGQDKGIIKQIKAYIIPIGRVYALIFFVYDRRLIIKTIRIMEKKSPQKL